MRTSFYPILGFLAGLGFGLAETTSALAQAPSPVAVILELRGLGVEIPRQPGVWDSARTNQALYPGNLVRTDDRSQVWVRFSELEPVRVGERSSLRIGEDSKEKRGFEFLKGLLYFFHRDKPDQFEIQTPQASAIIRGTEFVLEVSEDETSTLSLLEGEVTLSNQLGHIEIKTGQQGIVKPGQPPRTARLEAINVIQWFLYFPAVLNPDELNFSAEERQALQPSLTAYQQGDLIAAFAAYPAGRRPASDEERVYLAALRLCFGEIRETEELLDAVGPGTASARLASALRLLIAAVKGPQAPSMLNSLPRDSRAQAGQLSTSLLAESFWQQSITNLPAAREAARQATESSPKFSFAWARLAELEFGFGRTHSTREAIERSLQLAPRNAQAHALQGFVLAAANHLDQALGSFEQAIALDPALANGWLGRGLCRIRQGHAEAGRLDLQIAAMVEPNRALLRSYLGKAFANAGNDQLASHELNLARARDANDPTSWLYSALLKQQQNRVNDAIADLEASQERNANRALVRSRLLLDEDLAVRSANLASIYRDAGMAEVSVREAARAVTYDYAKDSAHLFLSDSYNELRDPTRFNLRYETVWFNELLLANLLSPVGGGRLSQTVSQQEYSRLFEADGLGAANSTLARTDEMFTELASQFGTYGGTSYALDLDYQHNNGVRPNNDLDSIEWYTTIKQQVTPQDTALALVKYEDYHSGDNFQYYDPFSPVTNRHFRPHFRYDEYEQPIAVGGWHHEWSPGMHTLLLGGRLEGEQHFSDQDVYQNVLFKSPSGELLQVLPGLFDLTYRNHLEIYTVELNQILQWHRVTLAAGGRYQSGVIETSSRLYNPSAYLTTFFDASLTNTVSSTGDFERLTGYGYLTVEPLDRLWLTGGLAYDDITYPRNFRHPPVSPGEAHSSQLGPKAAVVWEPLPQATLRGIFTRSLGGVSLDESFRLEPTQLAGFPQAFRTLIPESVAGSVSAPEYQTFGLALDLKFPTGTYAGIQAERLESSVRQTLGLFSVANDRTPAAAADSTPEHLDYRENSVAANLNQLLGDRFVFGASYRYTQANLHDLLPELVSKLSTARQMLKTDLQNATGYLLFNHPSGFYARAETLWYHQSNSGYSPPLPDSDFFQENLYAGYRFARRRIELRVGLLNLTGEDYHLNALTTYAELPRKRVFEARLNFQF